MNKFFAKHFVYALGQAMRGEPVIESLKALKTSQFASGDELRSLQDERLARVIEHAAARVPFYKHFFEQSGIDTQTVTLEQLPTVTKLDIRERYSAFCSEPLPKRLTKKTSGGSTGQTVVVLKDRTSTAMQRASMYRGYDWAGVDIGDKQVRFWGVAIDSKSRTRYRFIDFFMNRIRLSAFRFGAKDLADYYDSIRSFQPTYFYGYASMLYEFSQFVENQKLNGRDLGLKAIISTSEVLYPTQRQHMESVFGCRVFNEYGCGELGPVAFECEKGSMHINAENLIVEILHDDRAVEPGTAGEIVLTELNNLAMPLIRYRMGDVGCLSDAVCECGRSLPILANITGRALDFVTTADGRKIHGEYFNYLMEKLQNQGRAVRQFQIVQDRIGAIEFRLVKDEMFSDSTLAFLTQELAEILGPGTDVEFTYKDEIERLQSGKLRLVVSNL